MTSLVRPFPGQVGVVGTAVVVKKTNSLEHQMLQANSADPPVVPIISIFEKAFLCGQIINDSQTLIHDALSDQTISSFVPMFHGLTGG